MNIPLREKQILDFSTQGLTYAEMAQRLSLKVPTIKMNIRFLLVRLNAKTLTQAVAIAIRANLIN